jgi:hypothetical protein
MLRANNNHLVVSDLEARFENGQRAMGNGTTVCWRRISVAQHVYQICIFVARIVLIMGVV